jgi:hypothetical protein
MRHPYIAYFEMTVVVIRVEMNFFTASGANRCAFVSVHSLPPDVPGDKFTDRRDAKRLGVSSPTLLSHKNYVSDAQSRSFDYPSRNVLDETPEFLFPLHVIPPLGACASAQHKVYHIA